MRKTILIGRPSPILASLGGAAGVLLFGAVLQLAPAVGAPSVEVATGVGALFTSGAAALWLGAILLFLLGWAVLPLLLALGWKTLPGDAESVPGALLKGAVLGVAVWALVGLMMLLLGLEAGLFATAGGVAGAASLLVASLGYGVVTSAIASMGRGMAPLHTLGWEGHGAGRAA